MVAIGYRKPPGTQAEYAYEQIRLGIVTGQLRSGERILQGQWARSLEVSVTPVREALRRLEQDGLVESAPHRGTTVIGLDLGQAAEIYRMRRLVEPIQVERSIGLLTDSDYAKAKELCDLMADCDDVIKFTELNQMFHRRTMLYDGSWTSRTVEMLEAAAAPYVSYSLGKKPELLRRSNQEHYQLLDALFGRDLEESIRLTVAHLDSTMQTLETIGI